MVTHTNPNTSAAWRKRFGVVAAGLLVFVLLLGVGGYLLTQTSVLPVAWRTPSSGPLLSARTPAARWQQDLRYLANNLPRLHRDPFHSTNRATFDAAVAALDAEIPALTDDQIVTRMMALVASIGDGHTNLGTYVRYGDAGGWQVYGLGMMWLDGGWYVVSALPEASDVIGAEVLTIAGMPMRDLYAAVTPLIAADNEMTRLGSAPMLMLTPQVLQALGILEEGMTADFRLRQIDGQVVARTFPSVDLSKEGARFRHIGDIYPAAADQLALQQPDEWYWYTYLPDQQAIYFQFDRCNEMADKPFGPFVAALFATTDSRPTDRIVVDLRFNSGGNSAVLQPFITGLAARPQLAVYVLMGRQTFSSALMNANELDQQANGVLIGEPTGGRPNHYGEIRHFELPNSRLRVTYSTRYWRLLPDQDPPSLMPEIAAPATIADQLAGHDTALEAALAAVRAQ